MAKTFDSYEEADKRRVPCPICSKHKYVIFAVNGHFSVARCHREDCDTHCHGHEIPLEDHQSPDHVGMVSLR